jgi:phage baseplate assembly protein W
MPKIQKNYRDKFAYDISKQALRKGEIWDFDVINQSIELILTTYYGERLFNPYFGSPLANLLGEPMSEQKAESLLVDIINDIKKWEDRITIIENRCQLILDYDNNSIELKLPYYVNKNNIRSIFEKKIIL